MGNRVAIVTGGSSGIGRCTVTALAQSGCVVYELSRRDIPLKGVKHLNTDVTDETVEEVTEEATEETTEESTEDATEEVTEEVAEEITNATNDEL